MIRFVLCVALAALLPLTPLRAAEEAGRYTMTPVDDGVLRLDTRTGAVSVCRPQDNEWGCALVPDAHAALQREVANLKERNRELQAGAGKLSERNAALQSDVESLQERNRQLQAEIGKLKTEKLDARRDPGEKKQDRILSERERQAQDDRTLDEMMTVLEKMMKRFQKMIESLRDPPEGKQL